MHGAGGPFNGGGPGSTGLLSSNDEFFQWLNQSLISKVFVDAVCGDGHCDVPEETPAIGRFGWYSIQHPDSGRVEYSGDFRERYARNLIITIAAWYPIPHSDSIPLHIRARFHCWDHCAISMIESREARSHICFPEIIALHPPLALGLPHTYNHSTHSFHSIATPPLRWLVFMIPKFLYVLASTSPQTHSPAAHPTVDAWKRQKL